ncbi:hypothetical protein L1887_08564 [Cichorium endivia]|nr:hypothetical protein L1887_08564 [Cichorium endivia]
METTISEIAVPFITPHIFPSSKAIGYRGLTESKRYPKEQATLPVPTMEEVTYDCSFEVSRVTLQQPTTDPNEGLILFSVIYNFVHKLGSRSYGRIACNNCPPVWNRLVLATLFLSSRFLSFHRFSISNLQYSLSSPGFIKVG